MSFYSYMINICICMHTCIYIHVQICPSIPCFLDPTFPCPSVGDHGGNKSHQKKRAQFTLDSLSLSLSHAHTHTHTRTRTQAHTHTKTLTHTHTHTQ